MSQQRTPEELTAASWAALDEATRTGQITLPDGTVVVPEAKTLVDIFKWLAAFQGKPKKTPKAMDDWKPKETK